MSVFSGALLTAQEAEIPTVPLISKTSVSVFHETDFGASKIIMGDSLYYLWNPRNSTVYYGFMEVTALRYGSGEIDTIIINNEKLLLVRVDEGYGRGFATSAWSEEMYRTALVDFKRKLLLGLVMTRYHHYEETYADSNFTISSINDETFESSVYLNEEGCLIIKSRGNASLVWPAREAYLPDGTYSYIVGKGLKKLP